MKKHFIFFITFFLLFLIGTYVFKLEKTFVITSYAFKNSIAEVSFSNEEIKKSLTDFLLNQSLTNKNFSHITSEIILAEILELEKPFLERSSEKIVPIASLTKLMTAVVALENFEPDKIITFSSSAINTFGDFGNFYRGESYYLKDLVKGMLVSSSNDASVAIAEQIGVKNFVSLMNKKAKNLEMNNTVFVDPAGLSFNNRSTAKDLEKLVRYIMFYHPEIFEITKNPQIEILELNSKTYKVIQNDNKLTKESNFLGGKTGFLLNLNKGGLISLFKYKYYRLLIIVLNDGFYERYLNTKKILKELPQ